MNLVRRAALPDSIERRLQEGDKLATRIQSHVEVITYEIERGGTGWWPDGTPKGHSVFFSVRGVVRGFCLLKEMTRQCRCIFHSQRDRVGWDPEPWEDGHLTAPWDIAEDDSWRPMGDEEDLNIDGLFVEDVSEVAEAITSPPSSMVMCVSPAVEDWAWDISANGGLSPRTGWCAGKVRGMNEEFDPWTWLSPFVNWTPI
jgi:hypothetical protein